jgi:hypothetical protein
MVFELFDTTLKPLLFCLLTQSLNSKGLDKNLFFKIGYGPLDHCFTIEVSKIIVDTKYLPNGILLLCETLKFYKSFYMQF